MSRPASTLGAGATGVMPRARGGSVVAVEDEKEGLAFGFLIAMVMLFAVAADRLVIGVSTGGRGALPVTVVAGPALAAFAVWRFGGRRTLGFLESPAFLVGVLPYLVFTFTLPVLGVIVNRYPDRTLLSVAEATSAVSFMAIGAALSRAPRDRWRRWVMVGICVQLLYAGGQYAYLNELPGSALFGPFHSWDLSLQGIYGTLVQARSTGLYFNPNELGTWAGTMALLAWGVFASRRRFLGVSLAVLTLLLSQSRGASVALAAAAVVGLALGVMARRVALGEAVRALLSLVIAVGLVIVIVVLVEPSSDLVSRFSALIAVAVQGPRADPNLAGRLDYWASVVDLNALYPFGTFGPPEMLLGSAVDSTWFRVFAQGSVPYVATFVLLLASPLALRRTWLSEAAVGLTVLFAVAGLTQTPFNYPMVVLYWTLLGAAAQASTEQLRAEVDARDIWRPAARVSSRVERLRRRREAVAATNSEPPR